MELNITTLVLLSEKSENEIGGLATFEIILKNNPNFIFNPNKAEDSGRIFKVIIIDNDTNTYQQVIESCMEALNITYEEAFKIALAVDHNGMAEIAHAPYEEAENIAAIVRSIGIEVRVLPV